MDYYIYFPEEGEPQKLIAMPGRDTHIQPIIKGPKAGTSEQYPIRMYEWSTEDGSKDVYLIAYDIEPSTEVIEAAIVKHKLPPTTNYQDDSEE
ncbi:hypothetical protein KWH94_14835 [Citrobacter cronae]|uniref:hypothetical protein n=1 Tax=Citrobacter cronae TaxID=1748967 RepID=UPI0021CF2800|nr:hypothetical protein [Citrobacter cronae]MCU6184401.1 hypothetical protein [Citrobacter cronae]